MSAEKNNTYAQLGEDPAESNLNIRCTRAEKSAWVKAADGEKLARFVRRTLNESPAVKSVLNEQRKS